MTYDHWENPLVLALREARRQRRSDFQARYGSFWKCESCGEYLQPGDLYRMPPGMTYNPTPKHDHRDAEDRFTAMPAKRVGYTPPPERP